MRQCAQAEETQYVIEEPTEALRFEKKGPERANGNDVHRDRQKEEGSGKPGSTQRHADEQREREPEDVLTNHHDDRKNNCVPKGLLKIGIDQHCAVLHEPKPSPDYQAIEFVQAQPEPLRDWRKHEDAQQPEAGCQKQPCSRGSQGRYRNPEAIMLSYFACIAVAACSGVMVPPIMF